MNAERNGTAKLRRSPAVIAMAVGQEKITDAVQRNDGLDVAPQLGGINAASAVDEDAVLAVVDEIDVAVLVVG